MYVWKVCNVCSLRNCIVYTHNFINIWFFFGGGAFDVIVIKSFAMIFVSLCRMVFAILGVHLLWATPPQNRMYLNILGIRVPMGNKVNVWIHVPYLNPISSKVFFLICWIVYEKSEIDICKLFKTINCFIKYDPLYLSSIFAFKWPFRSYFLIFDNL